MALSKAICERCVNERASLQGLVPWGASDDVRWEEGELHCGITVGSGFETFGPVSVDGPPPKDCPYAAEQVVSDAE